MLVVTRKEGQSVDVVVDGKRVVRVFLVRLRSAAQARLGFEAEESTVKIVRSEFIGADGTQIMNKTGERR